MNSTPERVNGLLQAFAMINQRRNVAPDFLFEKIEKLETIGETIKLAVSMSAESNLSVEAELLTEFRQQLVSQLHGWMFVFLGYDNFRLTQNSYRLVDERDHYDIGREEYRMECCSQIAESILSICNPTEVYRVRLRNHDDLIFFRNFLLINDDEAWWLQLGERS